MRRVETCLPAERGETTLQTLIGRGCRFSVGGRGEEAETRHEYQRVSSLFFLSFAALNEPPV